jgi:phenylacetate-CoA ligase
MKHLFITSYAWLIELFKKPLAISDTTLKLNFLPGFNRLRIFNANAKAYAEFIKAKKHVPAYRDFLRANNFSRPSFTGLTLNIQEIPSMDKTNYINAYPIDERCVNGKIPSKGVIIDESSGSNGTAMNWVRGAKERENNARMIRFGIKNIFGKEPLFIINAFAMGSWATGINVSISCIPFSKLKSLGPDKLRIENTLKYFGRKHKYLIMGYPPFLKILIDSVDINWSEYNVSFVLGGEPMSEGMRDYFLSKGIKKIFSSFGASDLELNISSENDFTVSLRRLLRSNETLRKELVKYPGALPMIFQFNPADFLIESSASGELLITICRPGYISPKIRYNIHDRGHIVQLKELNTLLKKLNINTNELIKPSTDLPLLFHYGRADMTVSFFGANIGPVDMHETLYSLPEFSGIINSFCISTIEDSEGNKQLIVHLETAENVDASALNAIKIQTAVFDQLSTINQDFREAKKMANKPGQINIQLHAFGQGPFKDNDIRIKARYIE